MLHRSIKKPLSVVKRTVVAWQESAMLRQLFSDWRTLSIGLVRPNAPGPVRRLVIVPSDAHTLVGSRGDEAMMQAAVQQLAKSEPALRVGVLTGTRAAEATAHTLNFTPLPVWGGRLGEMWRAIEAFAPDAVLVVGADIMDGYYGALTPARMLAIADVSARRGLRTGVLGFSFNREPALELQPLFDGLNARVQLNLRDQSSLLRFASFSSAPAQLVADIAFLLEPDQESAKVRAIAEWAGARRAENDLVLGFNLHPMLVPQRRPQQLRALSDAASSALSALLSARAVSVLLLPHDYRGSEGDHICLSAVYERLRVSHADRLLYASEPMSAAELKATAGCTDGVITGRMHLAIAALGMGVPVAALTYQDKFQGLFQHFGLSEQLLLSPSEALDLERLGRLFEQFVSQLPTSRARVQERLPDVRKASARNLLGIV